MIDEKVLKDFLENVYGDRISYYSCENLKSKILKDKDFNFKMLKIFKMYPKSSVIITFNDAEWEKFDNSFLNVSVGDSVTSGNYSITNLFQAGLSGKNSEAIVKAMTYFFPQSEIFLAKAPGVEKYDNELRYMMYYKNYLYDPLYMIKIRKDIAEKLGFEIKKIISTDELGMEYELKREKTISNFENDEQKNINF